MAFIYTCDLFVNRAEGGRGRLIGLLIDSALGRGGGGELQAEGEGGRRRRESFNFTSSLPSSSWKPASFLGTMSQHGRGERTSFTQSFLAHLQHHA